MFKGHTLVTAIAALTLFASAANAQPAKDAAAAPAGTYAIDANHTAILARVPHGGFSYEIFRFTPTSGQLTWNPASPSSNTLNVSVGVSTIQTPVDTFAEELSGHNFLNVAQFPNATFVSTAFRQTDASHGQVDGNFTLKGVTKPVTFNVELIGAGAGMRGGTVIGVHATALVNNADFGFPPFITGQTELVIDSEFDKQ